MSLVSELQRRNVFRVAIAYVVLGWLLLQVTDVVVPILALPDWVARLVLFLLVLGLPLVLFFAWAYELTPEGIKREHEVDRERSITRKTGRKLDRAIIVVLALALAWFAWDRFKPGRPESVDTVPVIAVLPFQATGSEDGGFLAAGLHDDLLTRLAKLGAYQVISRTSMMEYADTSKNMREIGAELGAGYILEGGVQARGGRVRINAQLIHAADDEHLWAETYDRELTAIDLFDVQAELAFSIAEAMHTTLSPEDQALVSVVPTENLDAYNAYLRGINLLRSTGWVGSQEIGNALVEFEHAVSLDPEFALAWVGLATAHIRSTGNTFDQAASDAALAALAEARSLQPGLLEAEMAWAEYLYRMKHEYGEALGILESLGDRIAGNADGLSLKAWLHRRFARYEEGYRVLQTVWRLEPRSLKTYYDLTSFAWQMGNCDAARRHADMMLVLAPAAPAALTQAARYEMECNGDAVRAADLVRDIDFTKTGGWSVGFEAALSMPDAELLLELISLDNPYTMPEWPVWQQLNAHTYYTYVEPDIDRATESLERAAALLEAYGSDAQMADGSQYALLQLWYHGKRGDEDRTRHWVEEHRRRFRIEGKNDLFEEANSRFYYAWAFAVAGLHDEALEELRVMFEEPGGHRFPYVDGFPVFHELRDHPGYIALRERFGN